MSTATGRTQFTAIETSATSSQNPTAVHNKFANDQRIYLGDVAYMSGSATGALTMSYLSLATSLGAAGDWTLSIADATVAGAEGGDIGLTAGKGYTNGGGGDFTATGGQGGATGAGGTVDLTGGAGGATSGAGGACTMTGGAGTAGNSAGGACTMTGGAGAGNQAGGAITGTGGAGGATGAGGAVTITGGAGGATSGAGGATILAGGNGTAGNGNGGACTVRGGNAHGSGTDGVLSLGETNTSAVNIGAAGITTTIAGSVINSGDVQVVGDLILPKFNRLYDFEEKAAALAASSMNYIFTGGGVNGTQAIVADVGGIMRLDTGALANSSSTLTFGATDFGTNSAPDAIFRIRADAITNRQIYVGWRVDANDYLMFKFDTAVDANNIYLTSNNNGTGEISTDTTVDLTAATYFILKLKINADETFAAYINGTQVASGHTGTIRALTTFVPYFYTDNKNQAQSNKLDIDYLFLAQDRA